MTRRVLLAGGVIVALVASMLAAALVLRNQRADEMSRLQRSDTALQDALLSERHVVDLETGLRGYEATGERVFLAPWTTSRALLPGELLHLAAIVRPDRSQELRARGLQRAVNDYIGGYGAKLAASRPPFPQRRRIALTARGKKLLDALRARFASFDAGELLRQSEIEVRTDGLSAAIEWLDVVDTALTVLGLILFVLFIERSVVRPVRRASVALARLARGERDIELAEAGAGEVELLARSFNTAAGELAMREAQLHRALAELGQAENAARAAEQRFRGVFEQAVIGAVLLATDGRIEQANPAFAAICARPLGELPGLHLRTLLHPADVARARDAGASLLDGGAAQSDLELRVLSGSGGCVEVTVHSACVRDQDGHVAHLLCQVQDVGERKRFEAALQFMADHDPLTGLLNRRKFEAELGRHIDRVKRYGPTGALLVLDIDDFKRVNDTLGHSGGDELIVSIAEVLRARLRESDMLARIGGDEFAVLLPHALRQDGERVAQALVEAVRGRSTLLHGEPCRVTVSVGVAWFEQAREQLCGEAVLIDADLAMYDAKEAGRDRWAAYSSGERSVSRTKARLTWARRIELALEHDRFVLVAQPIVDLRSGTVSQHELLVRMVDEHGDQIPPAAFLSVAERFGMVAQIDEWVSRRAIELIAKRPELTLEVNISGRSLGDRRLLAQIEQALAEHAIEAGRLIFEVTETAAVANLADAQAFARRLRELGCRFALDDFGAGFGSFYYLKHLPFDFIKIDGEFVQHVAGARTDQLVIEAVVQIARGMGKQTIAEFVTDARTLQTVQRLGVDFAQGYYIGRPGALESVLGASSPSRGVAQPGLPPAQAVA
jgi:diguanylate cyclase (GGDEF)-like protein/PAS domain S-box-containing protein